ncbi:Cytochrome P450 76A2 [Vitis vinifera]|uniref:Cytochrome P450 76A2 n=1 Tax=Vitis vinifera TaxID=29760 RepID=A0A438EKA2_VITVI|nr:Cytochrome P450 76A2 [Vitis vinifera]
MASYDINQEKEVLGWDGEASSVHVAEVVFLSNMLGNLMLSWDVLDLRSKEGSEFFTIMSLIRRRRDQGFKIYKLKGNLSWLRVLQTRDLGKAMEMASGFVNERMKKQRTEGTKRKDFLDVLLEFEGNGKDEPAKISDRDVNIFILLLRNPKSMSEVKDELARVVEADRNVEESDIDELQYLQAVVKETL